MVYIREAHAANGDWPLRDPISLRTFEPKTFEARNKNASLCVIDLKIDIPCLIDNMENTTDEAYSAEPDRLFIISKDGKVAYRGDPGPWGFRPKEMEKELKKIVDK